MHSCYDNINEAFNECERAISKSLKFKSILLLIMMMMMRPLGSQHIFHLCYGNIHWIFVIVVELSLMLVALNEKCLYFIKLLECVNRCKLLLHQKKIVIFFLADSSWLLKFQALWSPKSVTGSIIPILHLNVHENQHRFCFSTDMQLMTATYTISPSSGSAFFNSNKRYMPQCHAVHWNVILFIFS